MTSKSEEFGITANSNTNSNTNSNKKSNKNIMKSRDLLFIFDARDCNPNAERLSGMEGPRIDPFTNKALISDVCLKRMIRDYFLKTLDSDTDNVLVRQAFVYTSDGQVPMKKTLLKDLGYNKDELKEKTREELINLIQNRFIDHRLFGSIFYVQRELFQTTGPIQFENSFSLNIPEVLKFSITSTLASESGKGAGSIGKYYALDYAIFLVHGISKESLAKLSGATEQDAIKLYKGMWEGIKSKTTRTKFQQLPRLLISVIPKDFRLQIPHLKDSITLQKKEPKCFKDCVLNLDLFLEKIEKFKEQIDKIEYIADPDLSYENNTTEFTDFEEIRKFIDECPELVKIDFS